MPPPPLLGYNNNVRHRGRVFHIQTEDSGINSPRIMTHLFADGGRIVKSTRTDYSEFIGQRDMAETVRNLMKEQHKAMFVALRSGVLDEVIGFEEDAPPPSITSTEHMKRATEQMERESIRAPVGAVPPAPEDAAVAFAAGESPTSAGKERPYAAPRPASIFSEAAPVTHLFGEVGGLDEKSLDDAILSYLAEDPKTSGGGGSGTP
jgi:hypothetical protein